MFRFVGVSCPNGVTDGFVFCVGVCWHCRFEVLYQFPEFGVAEVIAFADLHILEPVCTEFHHKRIKTRPVFYLFRPDIGYDSKFFKHFDILYFLGYDTQ